MPVVEPAIILDDDLKSEPATTASQALSPEIQRFGVAVAQLKFNSAVPLELDVVPPQQNAAWFKIFSEGKVALEKGNLVYRPGAAKLDKVVLFSMLANRPTARRELRPTIKR